MPLFAGGVLPEKGLSQRKRHQSSSFQTPRHSKPCDLKTSPSSKETNFASNFPDVSLSESPAGQPRDLCPRGAERSPAPGGSGGQQALPCPGAAVSALRGARAQVPRARPEGQTRLFRVISWPGVTASSGASPLPVMSVRWARHKTPTPARGLKGEDVPFPSPSQGFCCPDVVRPA